jgi:hypothetical protein
MRQFYETYRDQEFVTALLTQLPWTHNLIIVSQSKRPEEREFYLRTAIREQWSKDIMHWVRLHPYNISQKVQTVVEHFRENMQPLLDGRAKAMVVVNSRLEAVRVRWQKGHPRLHRQAELSAWRAGGILRGGLMTRTNPKRRRAQYKANSGSWS